MSEKEIPMKHPYHDYTLDDALELARSIKYGPIMKPSDPVPDIPEAIEVIKRSLKTCGFNWITGQVALELLRSANGEEVNWS